MDGYRRQGHTGITMTISIESKSSSFLRPEDLASSVVEVSHLYGFLALIFREEISVELLRMLRTPQMQQNLLDVGIELDETFLTEDEQTLLESLAVEYTALLLGPGGHVNPHESVQADKDGYLWGERTAAVRDFIERAGVDYSETFNGIPDHISVELEFMAMLTRFEGEEWQAENAERAANCLEYEREFLTVHLGIWCTQFCQQIIEQAEVSFYRQMAGLLRDFVASEVEDVPQRLETANQLLKPESQVDLVGQTRVGGATLEAMTV